MHTLKIPQKFITLITQSRNKNLMVRTKDTRISNYVPFFAFKYNNNAKARVCTQLYDINNPKNSIFTLAYRHTHTHTHFCGNRIFPSNTNFVMCLRHVVQNHWNIFLLCVCVCVICACNNISPDFIQQVSNTQQLFFIQHENKEGKKKLYRYMNEMSNKESILPAHAPCL